MKTLAIDTALFGFFSLEYDMTDEFNNSVQPIVEIGRNHAKRCFCSDVVEASRGSRIIRSVLVVILRRDPLGRKRGL